MLSKRERTKKNKERQKTTTKQILYVSGNPQQERKSKSRKQVKKETKHGYEEE